MTVGEGEVEVLKLGVKQKTGGYMSVIIVYVPPKTNAWTEQAYKKNLHDTTKELEVLLKENNDILMMGDFNCKEVSWYDWLTTGGEESWGNKLLELVMDNLLTQ